MAAKISPILLERERKGYPKDLFEWSPPTYYLMCPFCPAPASSSFLPVWKKPHFSLPMTQISRSFSNGKKIWVAKKARTRAQQFLKEGKGCYMFHFCLQKAEFAVSWKENFAERRRKRGFPSLAISPDYEVFFLPSPLCYTRYYWVVLVISQVIDRGFSTSRRGG